MLCTLRQLAPEPPAEGDLVAVYNRSRPTGKPRIVVLGTGWGAVSFLKSLKRNAGCALQALALIVQGLGSGFNRVGGFSSVPFLIQNVVYTPESIHMPNQNPKIGKRITPKNILKAVT